MIPYHLFRTVHFIFSHNIFQTKKYCSVVGVLNLGTLTSGCDTSRLIYLKNEFKRKYFLNSQTRITRPTSTRKDHVLANAARETLQMEVEVEVEVVGAGLSDHFTQTIALYFKKSPAKKPAPGCNALGVPGIFMKWIKKLSSSCYRYLIYDQLGKVESKTPQGSVYALTAYLYVQIM